jgi:pimeloyl-ACP methyl ester carboxylesterase
MKRMFFVVSAVLTLGCGGKKPAPAVPGDAAPAEHHGGAPDAIPADAPAGTPAAEEVTITGGDVDLAATYYGPADPQRDHGCAIFVHQLSSTRAEYAPVIERLRGKGHLIAIDMRGHGASTKGKDGATLDWQAFETKDWLAAAADLSPVTEEMVRRGADNHCVLVGASIGSSEVLVHAAANPDSVKALVLLSPGLGYRGVMTPDAARAVHVPVLLVHSQEKGAADAAGALAGIWNDATPLTPIEVIADPGQAHGMKIVAGDPKVLERVVGFIGDELAK